MSTVSLSIFNEFNVSEGGALGRDGVAGEDGGEGVEAGRVFGRKESGRASARTPTVHFGVTAEIVGERVGHYSALTQHGDVVG